MISQRRLQDVIEQSLHKYPVVGLIGPRQTGKTTLAKTIQSSFSKRAIYLDLELPSDQNKLRSPELYLKQFSDDLVIIDEVQRIPTLFPLIRALVDQKRVNGRFLILGSAAPALIRQASESLAGRIRYHELTPFTLDETCPKSHEDVAQLWLRGGYPNSYLSGNDDESLTWREAFIKTYLEMDIPQLGIRVPAVQLRRFWTMLAHLNGQIWNASRIAGSLGISPPTARHYLDILEDTFIVRQLQPYHTNIKKRLIKSPKIYVRDTGILHALLSLKDLDGLLGHPTTGSSWEGFVIEQILAIVPERWKAFFYRTSAGAELDLLLLDDKGRTIGIEIKHSAAPAVNRGFWSALEDVSCTRGYVIYPGDESYPLGENVVTLAVRELSRIME